MPSYIYGDIVAPNLIGRLLEHGLDIREGATRSTGSYETRQGSYLYTAEGEFTGFVVVDHDTLAGASERMGDAFVCADFDDLLAALKAIPNLASAYLDRKHIEDPDNNETHEFRDGTWYIGLSLTYMVPEDHYTRAWQAANAAIEATHLTPEART